MTTRPLSIGLLLAHACTLSCGDDDNGRSGTIADQVGVGAQCASNADCRQPEDRSFVQVCLQEFKGGYCGLADCATNDDCPPGSACVDHEGGTYCFRQCADKLECNRNRIEDVWSNCSSNIEFTDARTTSKACVPPSN
jgi:hypothetical protein